MAGTAPTSCMNCGARLHGNYCSACGQSHRYPRLRLREWLSEVLSGLLSFDTPVIRTVVGLTLQPGGMVRRFVDGQRVRFTGPLRYAICTSALWIAATAAFPVVAPPGPDAALLEQVQRWFLNYGQVINLAALPLIAASLWIVFLGTRSTYAEHLAFITYVIGHLFLLRTLLLVVRAATDMGPATLVRIDQILVLALFTWGCWSFHRGFATWRILRVPAAVVALSLVSAGVSKLAIWIALQAR